MTTTVMPAADQAEAEADAGKDKKEKKPPEPQASFGELIQYASPSEKLILFVSICSSLSFGATQPVRHRAHAVPATRMPKKIRCACSRK